MINDTRERIAALEVQVQHLAETLDKTNVVVTELRDLLLQAKGARWLAKQLHWLVATTEALASGRVD